MPIVNGAETKKVTLSDLGAFIVSAVKVVADEAATSAELASVDARITSAVQVASAAATSADGHANTVSAQVVSAVNVVSNALSALEVRVSTLSGAPGGATSTYVDNQISIASAQALSAINVVSNALSALEVRVSTMSNVASNALSQAGAASAAATSVEAQARSAINATSNALSLQIYSVRDAEISNRNSAVQVASAAATSADGHAAAASAAATSAEAAAKSAANAVSVQVHADLVSADTALSATLKADAVSAAAAAVSAISTAVYRGQTWVLSAPAIGGVPGPKIATNATAKKINAYTISTGTAVTFNIENRATVGAAGTNLMAAELSCSAADASGAINAGTSVLTAGNWLWIDISGTSGSPAAVVICLTTTQP
jgi:hypothetical protein